MRPGDKIQRNGHEYTVSKTELRGFAPNETHWAQIVRNQGVGKTSRLIDVKWIQFEKEGKE